MYFDKLIIFNNFNNDFKKLNYFKKSSIKESLKVNYCERHTSIFSYLNVQKLKFLIF